MVGLNEKTATTLIRHAALGETGGTKRVFRAAARGGSGPCHGCATTSFPLAWGCRLGVVGYPSLSGLVFLPQCRCC